MALADLRCLLPYLQSVPDAVSSIVGSCSSFLCSVFSRLLPAESPIACLPEGICLSGVAFHAESCALKPPLWGKTHCGVKTLNVRALTCCNTLHQHFQSSPSVND